MHTICRQKKGKERLAVPSPLKRASESAKTSRGDISILVVVGPLFCGERGRSCLLLGRQPGDCCSQWPPPPVFYTPWTSVSSRGKGLAKQVVAPRSGPPPPPPPRNKARKKTFAKFQWLGRSFVSSNPPYIHVLKKPNYFGCVLLYKDKNFPPGHSSILNL